MLFIHRACVYSRIITPSSPARAVLKGSNVGEFGAIFRSLYVWQNMKPTAPVNGLRGAPRPPLQSPRPRGEIGASHCVRLRTPACGTAKLDATRPIPGTRPSGQRKRCSTLLPAILSCLGSPQSAIPGGLTLSSILRLTDFKRGLIGFSNIGVCF